MCKARAKVRYYHHFNAVNFARDISKYHLDPLMNNNDVNVCWDLFVNWFSKMMDKHVSFKMMNFSNV